MSEFQDIKLKTQVGTAAEEDESEEATKAKQARATIITKACCCGSQLNCVAKGEL